CDCGHLITYSSCFGQFVDDFSVNQCGVHVENHQTAIAAEQTVLLESDIDVQFLGNGQELGAQLFRVSRFTAYGEFDAAFALIFRQTFRNTAGQTVDMVNVQAMTCGDGADAGNMFCRNTAGEQG